MALGSEKKIIDNHNVEVTKFGGTRGLRYQLKLAGMLKDVIKDILPSEDEFKLSDLSNLSNLNIPLVKLVEGLLGLLSIKSEQETMDLIKGLLQETTIDGKDLNDKGLFDEVFAGEFGLLYKTLLFVLKVNYSFLSESDIG